MLGFLCSCFLQLIVLHAHMSIYTWQKKNLCTKKFESLTNKRKATTGTYVHTLKNSRKIKKKKPENVEVSGAN